MKTCIKCGMAKPLENFRSSKRMKGGRENGCKDCHNIRRRAAYKSDPAKTLAVNAKWAKENKPAANEYRKKWARKHDGPHYRTAKRMAEIADLSDSYVRQLLAGQALRHSDIPQPLVNVHRELLRLKRAIHERL